MVDIVALSAGVGGLDSPVAALPQPSAAALQVLSEISSGGLSLDQVTALSTAVAQVDTGVQNAAARQALLNQVSGLGMYFRNTDPDGFPRWPVMTALRAYGLNISGQSEHADAAVAAQVQQQLNSLALQNRGTSLGEALAAATAAVVVGPVVQQAAPRAPAKTPSPAPVAAPVPSAPVKAVDKLV